MAEHFKFYPDARDTIVPWNARYQFPSQANKATKVTPRIPPKNGGLFSQPSAPYIRLEFPADGYVNPLNTSIAFNVNLTGWSGTTLGNSYCRFQNNIQSLFRRVRILYGSTPLEDIIDYNRIVRMLTEHTANAPLMTMDASSIADGIGGVTMAVNNNGDLGMVNVRQDYIQGIANGSGTGGKLAAGAVPNSPNANTTTRRYQVNLAAGLFTQDKLIPTKFMASQLAIEIELAPVTDCMFGGIEGGTGMTPPSYTVDQVYLIPEILHFDPAYDQMFLRGLREGGVPIKFASWHTFNFSTQGGANLNLPVQERSRSVKALFCTQRRPPGDTSGEAGNPIYYDSGAQLAASSVAGAPSPGIIQQYQWRIGGRYFPAAPVTCAISGSGNISNEGAEAWKEAEKAFNIVGDYRLSQANNTLRWCKPYSPEACERDYRHTAYRDTATGAETTADAAGDLATAGGMCGNLGSACFVAAVSLESSNGMEISGLNAEEQSDISFLASYNVAQVASYILSVYTHFDAMLVLRENNVMELIQ